MADFLSEFEKLLTDIILCKEQFLITGDFIIHVDNPDNNYACKCFDLLSFFGLEQHVTESTHIHGHTLDLLITRNSDLMVKEPLITDRLFSDHFTVVVKLNMTKQANSQSISTSRKLKSIDRSKFR